MKPKTQKWGTEGRDKATLNLIRRQQLTSEDKYIHQKNFSSLEFMKVAVEIAIYQKFGRLKLRKFHKS